MTISTEVQALCHALTTLDTTFREELNEKLDNIELTLDNALQSTGLPESAVADNRAFVADLRALVRQGEGLCYANHLRFGHVAKNNNVDLEGQVANGGGGKYWEQLYE